MAIGFSAAIKRIFAGRKTFDEDFFDDCCDALIEGDIAAKTAFEIIERVKKSKCVNREEVLAALKNELLPLARSIDFDIDRGKTNIFLVLGVNGAGKTTTIAKLAASYKDSFPLVIAAADTYRAAAIDQLKIHGERLSVRVIAHQDGADPPAVIFDAAESVSAQGGGLVLADTAGRLHTKENLMRELQKIERVAVSKASPCCCKKILVIDATTGQNAARQAEAFHEAVKLDALILTKADSTAKGGSIFSIGKEFGIPVFRVCFGEQYKDIAPFNPQDYTNEFLGLAP
ncbi:MAG: signal recognition particle-docking protein FtsY [Treponemataceae bacterium]|nr:MAG: signal recognition particle-docking protein FtsY [Treponemataceae bacterium]